jgi:pantoate--beta-alanine ligase
MIQPDEAFFGQKDLQQCMVVNRLIKDTFPQIRLNLIPTKREDDGLAMSSRNVRLTTDQREVALALSKAIFEVKNLVLSGMVAQTAIAQATQTYLNLPILKLEYLALVNAETMEEANTHEPTTKQAVIIACWCAEVRLIDNVLLMD